MRGSFGQDMSLRWRHKARARICVERKSEMRDEVDQVMGHGNVYV